MTFPACHRLLKLIFLHVLHVLNDHQCNLERDGIIEHPQVESRGLLDLVESVDKRISVNEKLSGSL